MLADIDLPVNPTAEDLERAYSAGLLRKEALEHGAYYLGHCRNASVARWHAAAQCFFYRRYKFGSTFIEEIRHPEDERSYDVFLPMARIEPTEAGRIDDATFEREAQALQRR
jgi:hypothetical protein